jgi:hypothetical protein
MSTSSINNASEEAIHALSLRAIASWDSGTGIAAEQAFRASVPALQRGLVWKPQQIEMLWDSLLRGFPIGALVVCRKIDKQERGTGDGVTHHLLDGQQRCNAIALGFTDPFPPTTMDSLKGSEKSILWLDLQPEKNPNSTRNYLARLTTLAHPWGYTTSDSVDRLPTNRIRNSLTGIGLSPADSKYQRPSPAQLWPHDAIAPVPLSWLLLAPLDEQSVFWRYICDRTKACSFFWTNQLRRFLEDSTTVVGQQKEAVFLGMTRANSARIIALNAPQELLEVSQQEKVATDTQDPISNIEHLFQRLNQQGTRLDGEELAYSMIKAYWPELADPIDGIAHGRMPEPRMVTIGVRAALAREQTNRLPSPMTISALRAVARGHDPRKQAIYEFIETRLEGACELVDAWLRYNPESNRNGLLPVHITSIALGSPDVYLLLLCFAERLRRSGADHSSLTGWSKPMQGLATLMHWFAVDSVALTNRVYGQCQDHLTLTNIRLALEDSIKDKAIHPPHTPASLEAFVRLPDTEFEKWRWWGLIHGEGVEDRIVARQDKWWGFLGFRENREILLYAQRAFLARRFPDYDPARKDLWEAHNRPWDFDHILASKYLYWRKGGDFKGVCYEWSNTIGNFRAWPFEDNRSDQAETAAQKIREEQLGDSFLNAGEQSGFSSGEQVRHVETSARVFVTACRQRLLRIYREWYESVGIADLVATDERIEPIAPKPTPTEAVIP